MADKYELIGQWLDDIGQKTEVIDVLRLIRKICEELGADRTSYHLTPKLHSQTDRAIHLLASGFSSEWISLYEDPEFRCHDPIPDLVMQYGEPITWLDALALRKLSKGEQGYADALKAHGLEHGIGIPLYGKNMRHAYCSFTFPDPEMLQDSRLIATIAALSRAAHLKICSLIDQTENDSGRLSERERQVVQRIASGFSNKAIADDLEISLSTADTYVKRVFAKLEVNDRIGATIKALEKGILLL
ncbi:helix-turn-helix transcriptional regulator [Parasphingorhabdus marina]|uniref:helix-turn-helix transcriptional regulator n=1 Tax=Parasphingorhabdus marina TaxID=394732 RepID=UPI0013566096|nr:autoinducer binding domain-containing protein [Parasphingorhabdus marina]